MEFNVIVPEVRKKLMKVEADNLEAAFDALEAGEGECEDDNEDDNVDSAPYILERDEFQVVLPSGEVVDAAEAFDRESFEEEVGV